MKTAARPNRLRRNLCIAAVLVVLFTVIGFFVVPPVVKAQLEKRASAAVGRKVTVQKVRFNPYALSLTLENFDIRLKEGEGSFMGWDRLYVNFDALASLTGSWVLGAIELDGFRVATVIEPDGSLNYADILARLNAPSATPAAPAKPGRPIRIDRLKVGQARVEFTDLSRPSPFQSTLGPVTFALTGFQTTAKLGAPSRLEALTEAGEKISWSGTLSVYPVSSRGEFEIANLVLKKYMPYLEGKVQAQLTDGKLSLKGSYEASLGEQRVVKLTGGEVHLRDLKVAELATHQSAVELAALDITGIQVDALAMKATVGSVGLRGGRIVVRREKDGALNLLAMLQPTPTTPGTALSPTPAAATPAKTPDFMVGEVALKDFQVDVSDLAAPRPAQLGLNGIQFSLKNVTLADGATMPLQLALGWSPQGTVHVEGTVAIKPELKADLKTDVTALELLPLSPYLEQFLNARLTQGTVTLGLAVQARLPAGQPLDATAAGEVKVEKFGLVDGAHNEELAGVGALVLTGLKASTAPQLTIAIEEVNLTAPYARVLVNNDKTLNLAVVAHAEKNSTAEAPASAPAAEPAPTPTANPPATTAPAPKITIGRVVLAGGDFTYSDQSLEPNVRLAINQFGGTVTGLSSENLTKAGVDLKAMVDGAGPVAITGQLDPLGANKFVDLKIDFRNVDLLPLSPYSGKFAGYELARGKLMLEVKFLLDGKKIDSANVVTLNQFAFGNATNSPDATGLPVRLGVALLKDRDGKIVIDVPVQGSTDDPNFRIGKVVWRVIGNLLTKVATSPFSLLGSMFGGGGDELGYQEFVPGAFTVQPTEIKKLETMVTALTNRPALSVAIEGAYDGPADTFALKRQKLAETVRRAIWEQKHALSPNILPPDQLVITPEENAMMLRQLFSTKFPVGTEFGAPLAKAPEAAPPPPAPKKNFFGRVVDVITFKSMRSEKPKSGQAAPSAEVKSADGTVIAGPAVDEMTGRLAETMEVGDNDLGELAAARAQQVRDYFINVGKIDPERLFLAKGQVDPAKAAKGPRAFLSLQ